MFRPDLSLLTAANLAFAPAHRWILRVDFDVFVQENGPMRIDDPRDPAEAKARYELERAQIIDKNTDEYWRGVRRRASLLVAVFVPIMAALLLASFPYLTRTRLTGAVPVLTDAALGGLLGGVLVAVPRLTALARIRRRDAEFLYDGLIGWIVVPPLALGPLAGVGGAFWLLRLASRDSYKPQTVYFLAVALAVAFCRWVRITAVGRFREGR